MASVNGKTSVLENDGFPRPKNRDMMVAAPIGFERVKEESVVRKNRQHAKRFQPITAPPGRQQENTRAAHLPPKPLDALIVTFSPDKLRESRQKKEMQTPDFGSRQDQGLRAPGRPPSADTASYGEPPPVHCGFSSIQLYHRWPAPPRSSRHGAAAHPPAFERVHQQRGPDQQEARQARGFEGLVEQPHPQRQLQAG